MSRVFAIDENFFLMFQGGQKQYFTGWNEEGFGLKNLRMEPRAWSRSGDKMAALDSFPIPQLDFVSFVTVFLRL